MILRFLISAVFLIAGLLKLRDPLAFADGIAAFHLFPVWMINPLALSIPYFEVFTGIGILVPRTRSPAALAACGLSLGFIILYASAIARGLDVRCACFGKWELLQASTRDGFARAIVLFAACLWVYARELAKGRKPV
ncbi:MAG: MauE/DoxX family redox-associated membrane protein [Terrimicrobiaceae bacterium]